MRSIIDNKTHNIHLINGFVSHYAPKGAGYGFIVPSSFEIKPENCKQYLKELLSKDNK